MHNPFCHIQEEEVVQPLLKKKAVPSCTPVNNFSVKSIEAHCIVKQLALETTQNKYVYWNIYSWKEIDTENKFFSILTSQQIEARQLVQITESNCSYYLFV